MKKIKILGTGCQKCADLANIARRAADDLGMAYEIEKVTDIMSFVDFGVMVTPAMVVDGVVKISGKVPSLEETKKLLL